MPEGKNHVVAPGTGQDVAASPRDFQSYADGQGAQRELKPSKLIAGAVRGVFDLRISDLENFHHLIVQRVRDQSVCIDEKTEVVVYLSNGTSRRLSSFDEFRSFARVDSAVPTVVNIGISIKIQFQGSPDAEIQNIDIAVRASDIPSETIQMQQNEDRIRFASDKMQIAVVTSESELGIISYTIDHSRISWGLDIENLIQAHAARTLKKRSAPERVLKVLRGPLHSISTLVVGLFLAAQAIDLLFWFLYETEGMPEGSTLLDTAAYWMTNGHIAKYIVMSAVIAMTVILLVSMFVRVVLKNIHKPRPSFIILSEHDEARREEKLASHQRRWARVCAILFLNLATIIATVVIEDRVASFIHFSGAEEGL